MAAICGTVLTNSNMLVLGEPGNGKSSAVKTMLYRQAAFYGERRFISISESKGDRWAPRPRTPGCRSSNSTPVAPIA